MLILTACSKHKPQVYTSDCTNDYAYRKLSYRNLMDSLNYYNGKFIEVDGIYQQGKHLSALVNDSSSADKDAGHSIWINFSPDCPLYMPNTHIGLFEAQDGEYKSFNDTKMVVRGRLQLHQPTDSNKYVAILNDIIYLKLQ